MATAKQISKSNSDLATTLATMLEDDLSLVTKSIGKLEKNIINSMSKLSKDNTNPELLQMSLKNAQQLHKNVVKEVELHYNTTVGNIVSGYSNVDKAIETRFKSLSIPITYNTVDKDMFAALKSNISRELNNVGSYVTEELVKGMYDMVLTGTSFNDVVKRVQGSMSGSVSKAGVSMSSYASGKVHDSLMGYYSQVEQKKAGDANLDTFLYYGNLIASSRPFCIVRAGRIFTRAQISSWDAMTWKGKKRGPTFINRGGYNCRHSFMAVRKSWVNNDKIDVQNWWEEEQREMPLNLRGDVLKEEKRLASFSPKPSKAQLSSIQKDLA